MNLTPLLRFDMPIPNDGFQAEGRIFVAGTVIEVLARLARTWRRRGLVEVSYFGSRAALTAAGCAPDWLFEENKSGKSRSGFRKDDKGFRMSKASQGFGMFNATHGDGRFRVTRHRFVESAAELPGVSQAAIDALARRDLAAREDIRQPAPAMAPRRAPFLRLVIDNTRSMPRH